MLGCNLEAAVLMLLRGEACGSSELTSNQPAAQEAASARDCTTCTHARTHTHTDTLTKDTLTVHFKIKLL